MGHFGLLRFGLACIWVPELAYPPILPSRIVVGSMLTSLSIFPLIICKNGSRIFPLIKNYFGLICQFFHQRHLLCTEKLCLKKSFSVLLLLFLLSHSSIFFLLHPIHGCRYRQSSLKLFFSLFFSFPLLLYSHYSTLYFILKTPSTIRGVIPCCSFFFLFAADGIGMKAGEGKRERVILVQHFLLYLILFLL